ncbi:hypothetical protein ScalyP_jg269 [Parmales sp. scaly parma]|nr:hypothetical protein ScalyP_jg269 [Parmales sp. scaly parma]
MWNNTPLISSIQYNATECAVHLLTHHASEIDVGAVTERGATAILHAATEDCEMVIEMLLKGWTLKELKSDTRGKIFHSVVDKNVVLCPLEAATICGNLKVVKMLVGAGFGVGAEERERVVNHAIQQNHARIVDYYLKEGIVAEGSGKNVMEIAASVNHNHNHNHNHNNKEMIEMERESHFDFDDIPMLGQAPTAIFENVNVIQQILEHQVDDAERMRICICLNSAPILHKAVANKNVVGVEAILREMNRIDGKGWTPLMHAAKGGYCKIANLLLSSELGCDVSIRDGHKRDAASLAKKAPRGAGRDEILKLLQQRVDDEDVEKAEEMPGEVKMREGEIVENSALAFT